MTTRARISRAASAAMVDALVVERDWVLAHVVSALGAHQSAAGVIFKGGTALRLVHFPGYRYSADLDFSLTAGTTRERGYEIITETLARLSEVNGLEEIALDDDSPPRIVYRGPLGGRRTVKLDLADDELVEETERRALQPIYSDVPPSEVAVYSLSELASEKLRCVIQRVQCRDLFDLHHLMCVEPVDATEAWGRFERKARHRGIDPDVFPTRLDERLQLYRARWDDELDNYVAAEAVPPFDTIVREVRRALRPCLNP